MIAEFHWKATNRFGQKQQGKCLAPSRKTLEKQLLNKGYSQLKISRNFVFPQNPKNEEITQTLNQIALLLNAAIPLKATLLMILQNCSNIRLYSWLQQLITDLESGLSFSTALNKQNKFLTSQEIQLIKMGDTTGQMGKIFYQLAQTRTKTEKLQKKVKKILFYPVIVLLISLSLSLSLLIFIVPQFAELYGAKEKSLPLITEILFYLSQLFTENLQGMFIILGIIISLFIWLKHKTTIIVKLKLAIFSRLPLFRKIINHSRIIYFTQNCALMLKASIPLDIILNSFIDKQNNDTVLNREIGFTLQLLKQGYPLHEGLNPTIFGNEVIQMIAIGEQSGNLSEMLNHIGEIYQQRLDYQIDLLSQLLEPILMLIMGIIVGTIIVGLYLPIFDMGALVE